MNLLLAALLFVALGGYSPAGEATPAASVVQSHGWGFDEDVDGDKQPDFWQRQLDSTHPHYVIGGLDRSAARDGSASLMLLAGGAPAVFLSPAVPIEANTACDISVWVRAQGLSVSGLRATSGYVEARLYDADATQIAVVRGFPAVTGTTDWTRVHLADVGRKAPAASLRVALVLDGLALEGGVWFDSVEVRKRPLAFLKTNGAGNAFRESDQKILTFEARGLPEGKYVLKIALTDAEGAVAHEASFDTAAGSGGTCLASYALPALPVGPYSIVADLVADGQSVLTQMVRMGILPDSKLEEKAGNFAISLSEPPERDSVQTALVEFLGVGWMKFPLAADSPASKAAYLQTIARLRRAGIMPVGTLLVSEGDEPGSEPGGALLRRMGESSEAWVAAVGDTVNTFAGSVQWWQVGDDSDTALSALMSQPDTFAALRSFINGLSFQSSLGLPLRSPDGLADAASPPDFCIVAASSVAVPATPPGAPIRHPVEVWAWKDVGDWAAADTAAASRAAADIAGLFSAGTRVVVLREPWERLAVIDGDSNITPFGVALTNLIHELGNHAYSGAFQLPNDTPNALFKREGSTKVLLWPSASPREERLFLGDSVEIVDMYGRRSPLRLENGEHVILVDKGPVMLIGVDPGIAETRMTFDIEPALIDSAYAVQPLYVSFTNRFASAIIGELILKFPPGWDAEPKLFSIRLKPGESFRGRTNLVVPYNALAGPQPISATLNIGGSQRTTIVRRCELGSGAFKMDVELRPSPTGLIVYQKVTNISASAVELEAFLEGAGLERVERLPKRIEAGGNATFSYTLGDPAQWAGKPLRASVRERRTSRFLNIEFAIPTGVAGQ